MSHPITRTLLPCFLALCLLSISSKVYADQRQQCDPVNYISTQNVHLTVFQAVSLFNLIDESNWGTAKHSLSGGATLPIEVPITAQGSYNDFSKWWSKKKNEFKYDSTQDINLSTVTSLVSDNDLDKYRACLAGYQGLSSFLRLNGNQAEVEVAWHPAPPVPGETLPSQVAVELVTTQGTDPSQTEPATISINGDISRTYNLTPGAPFSLIAQIKGVTSTRVSALIPKIYTCTITSPVETTLYNNGNPVIVQGHNNSIEAQTIASVQQTWRAQLESEGKTNVVVTVLPPMETKSGGGWGRSPTYTYYLKFSATYGGDKAYGPNPRCTHDE